MQILDELDKLFAEKKLPLKKQEIVNNQTLYQGSFMAGPGKKVPFGINSHKNTKRKKKTF